MGIGDTQLGCNPTINWHRVQAGEKKYFQSFHASENWSTRLSQIHESLLVVIKNCLLLFFPFIIIIVSYTSSNTARSASSDTQRRSVGSEWTMSKVFMNGQESPRDAILNEPVLRLFRMLVSDWAQKNIFVPNRRQASVALLLWFSYTNEFTCKLECLPYLSGSCVRAFFEKNFSVKMGPTKPKISHNLACKVRFPYNRIQLSCIYVSTLFILTICGKKYEIVACMINLWGYTEILPNYKCTNRSKKWKCGLMKGKSANTRALPGLFMQLFKFTLPVSFDSLVSRRRYI